MAEIADAKAAVTAALYCAFNVASSTSIVFVNRIVFTTYSFTFVTTLTLVHTLFTWSGMHVMSKMGFFEPKQLPQWEMLPLAFGYVGYVVLGTASLNLNPVAIYQILKIAIAPTVIVLEFFLMGKTRSGPVCGSVALVCLGIGYATVTDKVALSNVTGMMVGLASTVVTALYQIWVGSKQKELKASSAQLLLAYTPQAAAILICTAPLIDNYGWGVTPRPADSLLGYHVTLDGFLVIALSGMLGVLVSLSMFLVVGATSSLTYNVVGHLKTVLIMVGAFVIFKEPMGPQRLIGLAVTFGGIFWYTYLTVTPEAPKGPSNAVTEKAAEKAGGTPVKKEASNGGHFDPEKQPLVKK